MIYFTSPHVNVYWEEVPACVHTEWHGFVNKHNLKAGLLKAIELAQKKRAWRWVSDLSDMHVYEMDDQQWIINKYFPALVAAGVKKMAFIKPKLPVTLMSISRIVSTCDPKKEKTAFFDDLPAAYEWLMV